MSSNRPFIAARVEQWVDQRTERIFRSLGWQPQVIAHTGYGTENSVRILGRVVLFPPLSDTQIGKAAEEFLRRRGWRNFLTAATVHARYTITCGEVTVSGATDRGGYIDHRLSGHGLPAGWHQATITLDNGHQFREPLQIIDAEETFGIISDLDDTVISTMLPRPFVAAWNSFFRTEAARQAVPGMAALYTELLAAHPSAPIIYLSTGAWNTQGFLSRFLTRHRFPAGPMLLTDWGPTNTGWFRSGQQHKISALLQLSADFPRIRWLLVGDDGQHDPGIYTGFTASNPGRVRAILIRELNPAEQFLAHGTLEPIGPTPWHGARSIPVLSGSDGRDLWRELRRRPALWS